MFSQFEDITSILLETISEGVVIIDNHQKIVEVNTSAENIFGYNKEDIVGKELNLLIPSKYHKSLSKNFEKLLKAKTKIKIGDSNNIYGLRKDGSIIQIEVELNPFTIYNKTFILALISDISKIKKIEKSLLIKSRALESATNGVVITDALKQDNPIIYFNTAFKNLTGYDTEEILNKNCRFLHGEDRDQKPLRLIREAIKKGESCQTLLRNYKKDGTLFWNDLYIIPILDADGLVTNFIGILNDVTEKKYKDEERHHLSEIFDESLNEIHVFDAKTLKFINVNSGAQKTLGYTMDELTNMTPIDITPYKDEVEFRRAIDVLLKKNVEKLVVESIHKRKDGTEYPVETHLQLSKLGERDVFVAIILDITERKNYTNKLERIVQQRTKQLKHALGKEIEINQLKTKFLSLLSHEFKTPLSAILTSALLLSKYQLTEQQERRNKHIKTITDKAQLLNNILNGFLSIEKFDSGKLSYQFSNFKISEIVDEVIYNARMLIKDGQQIKYTEKTEGLSLYQDEKIIELILSNLLHNAIKYSPENSSIYLDIDQNDEHTTFTINDAGVGIPEMAQNKIFDRYFRAENVMGTEGTGVGLNIVKSHLDNLKGNIYFESKENVGTKFIVTIPNTAKE
jgi:PAS domain S-box-containing protein